MLSVGVRQLNTYPFLESVAQDGYVHGGTGVYSSILDFEGGSCAQVESSSKKKKIKVYKGEGGEGGLK